MEYKEPTEKEELTNFMLQIKWHTVNKRELKLIDKIIKLIHDAVQTA